MKKIVFIGVAILTVVGATIIIGQGEAKAQYDSGKWVAEYSGGNTPLRCVCVKNMFHSACRVGDITSKTSLCNGAETTLPGMGDINL